MADHTPSPKSVVRDMAEHGVTFTEYVSTYGLQRTEGVLLRYLADAYRALRQTVPPEARDETLDELLEWLGVVVRGTDSSLLDEWERLADPTSHRPTPHPRRPRRSRPRRARCAPCCAAPCSGGSSSWPARRWGALGALGDTDADGAAWTADRWHAALDPYFDEHDELLVGGDARGPHLLIVTEHPGRWEVRQLLDDPAGHHDWHLDAVVDLAASDEAGEPVWHLVDAGRL